MPARPKLAEGRAQPASQQLLLNRSGQVLTSDDYIFSTKKIGAEGIFGHIPFFEGLLPSLFSSPKNGAEIVIPCVQMCSEELPGIYDFHFLSIFWNAEPAVSCSIIERTGHYQACQMLQQAAKETAITLEKGTFAR